MESILEKNRKGVKMYFWQKLDQTEKDYIRFLYDKHCIKIGGPTDHKLKSGRLTNYFWEAQESFDVGALPVVGRAYAGKIIQEMPPGSFDLILGPAEKGTALAIATAMCLPVDKYGEVPVFWDRKVPKDYGSSKRPSWIVGPYERLKEIIRTQSVIRSLIPDDVITTGQAKKETMQKFVSELLMIKKELSVDRPIDVKWAKIYLSCNRAETDELGRNTIKVFESELQAPIGWVTDSYNLFGHLWQLGVIKKENVADFAEYMEKYGLPEDKGRLEELKRLVIV